MADLTGSGELNQPVLNLTPEEKRVFQHLFQQADTEKLGVITGEIAVKFFERTKLAPAVLGEIWQIADTENRGLLTMAGFCQVLRLIGHYQAGRDPSPELAFRPAPLPKFEGLSVPAAPPPAPQGFSPQTTGPLQPQISGQGPIRVPPLVPAKAAEYAGLFEKSGAVSGVLSGENAKEIFEKARLPNEVLGRIWNLSDTEQRGALNVTEFIIAMHLLASYRTGNMKALPNTLPPGLYEAASRRGGGLPPPPGRPDQASIPRQFSGQQNVPRTASPLRQPPFGPPAPVQQISNDWLIGPQEKASYDNLFKGVDTMGRGFITGEQAVRFFSDSGLPEDILAGIWDLADINSEGQLSKDEFAVAMFLIRQQRKGDPLPQTLPSNLIPPTLRNRANQQAPAIAPLPPQPKSAADDLFGLDAFSDPTPASPQRAVGTGGSAALGKPFGDSDPFSSSAASPTSPGPFQPQPRNPASTFKPFLPTSSFGQTLTSQSTGQSNSSQQRNLPSTMDDLLGESDPEINKKLTQDSTELANMSNQMTTLRNQMQEVQNKKEATQGDLASVTNQRRELETRLAQFKTTYEQEVKAHKNLEDRLAASRNETRKLQTDIAMLEGTYQDLQTQHRQVGAALEADQRENASLKERIRQMNAEIAQLRPQLEKMRTDARQQKGMVSINKKQFATNEGERDKIKGEMNELTRAAQEAARSPPQQSTPVAASPAASVTSQSTNPFFRKSPAPPSDNAMSPSGFAQGPHKDFDSVFGSFAPAHNTPPPVSFRSENQSNVPNFSAPSGQSVRSSEGPDVPTPSTSPPLSSYQESPRGVEPLAAHESRQFTSSFLPLRQDVPRSDSFSSSVKVSAPASRYGGPGAPGQETPTVSKASPAGTPQPEKANLERSETNRTETGGFNPSQPFPFDRNFSTASPVASVTSDTQRSTRAEPQRQDTFSSFGPPSAAVQDIPGAFPSDRATPLQQEPTGGSSFSNQSKNTNRADPFGSTTSESSRPGGKVDFDSAFAGFGSSRQNTAPVANGATDNRINKEFPPIEDLNHDDESDSDAEHGFDDNFTAASPQQKRSSTGQQAQTQQQRPGTASTDELYRSPPPPTTRLDSNLGGLPSADAQKSPPAYDSTVGQRTGSNQFPPEFGGLLPSREVPGSPTTSQSPEKSFSPAGGHGAALFGGPSSKPIATSPPPNDTPSSVPSDAYHSAVSHGTSDHSQATNQPQLQRSAFNDDFDAGFDDLTEAKEDDKADDDFMFSSHQRDDDEFNPVFDSPAASKSNTMASQQTPTGKPRGDDSFSDFEHLSQSFGQPQAPQPSSSTQDWDAIFSNLESSQHNQPGHSQQASTDFSKSVFDTLDNEDAAASSSKQGHLSPSSPQMPQLGRAISSGTEHDDPILKKLTGMGYNRDKALIALEKFDYDINKATDYLASGQ
jgi:epidermal growth factor receptor substrate 15